VRDNAVLGRGERAMAEKGGFRIVLLVGCVLAVCTSCAVSRTAVRETEGPSVYERGRRFIETVQDRFDYVSPWMVESWLRPYQIHPLPPGALSEGITLPPVPENQTLYALEARVVRVVTHDDIRLVEGELHSSALSTNAEVYRAAVLNIGNLTLDTTGEELEWSHRWGITRPQVHLLNAPQIITHENKPAMFADLFSPPYIEKPGCTGVMPGTRVLFMVSPGRDDRSVGLDLAFWSLTVEQRAMMLGPLSFDVGKPEADFQGIIAELQTDLDEWAAVARRVPDGGYLFVFLKITRLDEDTTRILSNLEKVGTPVYGQASER
jgi:hypothetical protein